MSRLILHSISLALVVLLLATVCQSAPAIDSTEKRSDAKQPLEQQQQQQLSNEQLASFGSEDAATQTREAKSSSETEKRSYGGGYGGSYGGRPGYSNGYAAPAYSAPQVYYQNYPVIKHRPYYQNKPIVIPVPQPVPQPVPVIIPVYKPCDPPSTAAPTAAPPLVHYYKDNKDKANKLLLAAMNFGNSKEQQQLELLSNKDTLAKNANQNNLAHFLEQV